MSAVVLALLLNAAAHAETPVDPGLAAAPLSEPAAGAPEGGSPETGASPPDPQEPAAESASNPAPAEVAPEASATEPPAEGAVEPVGTAPRVLPPDVQPGDLPPGEVPPLEVNLGEIPVESIPIADALLPEDLRWSGYGLPLVGINTTDGWGAGVGGEIFGRPRSETYGYRHKIILSTWYAIGLQSPFSLTYNSHYAQYEYRAKRRMLARIGYQGWDNMFYAGSGGDDVLVRWEEREIGNGMRAPYALFSIARATEGTRRPYAQAYWRLAETRAGDGTLLGERQPYGIGLGTYADVTVGMEIDTTDRWPVPTDGGRGEIDLRAGFSVAGEGFQPIVGLHAEYIRWVPIFGERLVIGGRIVGDKTVGQRPHFEQYVVGGRMRDELGFEQVLSGYGRIRTRGDGVVAGLVEVRPFLFRTKPQSPLLRFDVYGSFFAEQAYLFDGWDPGPPMPSVGLGPCFIWQGASQVRPFISYGWRADEPGLERTPSMQFGLSLMDPL